MRFLRIGLLLLAAFLASACDYWPRELEPLAASIGRQVSGEATAWLVGGDILVINVAGSPLYFEAAEPELAAHATEIAEQAADFVEAPLESIAITFHEREVSEDPDKMREFIFLIMDNYPVLQPYPERDATGPLTPDEMQAAIDRTDASFTGEQQECVLGEMQQRAAAAGDPETLDPSNFTFLSTFSFATWNALDAFGRRIFLAQAILTEAMFSCVGKPRTEVASDSL